MEEEAPITYGPEPPITFNPSSHPLAERGIYTDWRNACHFVEAAERLNLIHGSGIFAVKMARGTGNENILIRKGKLRIAQILVKGDWQHRSGDVDVQQLFNEAAMLRFSEDQSIALSQPSLTQIGLNPATPTEHPARAHKLKRRGTISELYSKGPIYWPTDRGKRRWCEKDSVAWVGTNRTGCFCCGRFGTTELPYYVM